MKVHLFIIISLFVSLSAKAQEKTATEKAIEKQGFIDIHTVAPTIVVDLMYSRADNFTGKILYTDLNKGYLHPKAAHALKRAQDELQRLRPDLSLKVYDAARPMRIQQRMWNVVAGTSKNRYVSNPKNGGGLHNYGLAVDITLCNKLTGDTLHMGTKIDYMGKLAHVRLEEAMLNNHKLSHVAIENRKLLRRVMEKAGFKVLATEWWHFNFCTRAEAKAKYKVIK